MQCLMLCAAPEGLNPFYQLLKIKAPIYWSTVALHTSAEQNLVFGYIIKVKLQILHI